MSDGQAHRNLARRRKRAGHRRVIHGFQLTKARGGQITRYTADPQRINTIGCQIDFNHRVNVQNAGHGRTNHSNVGQLDNAIVIFAKFEFAR